MLQSGVDGTRKSGARFAQGIRVPQVGRIPGLAVTPAMAEHETLRRLAGSRCPASRTNGYIAAMVSKAQRIILADHTRLPWRFFGRLMASVQARL